MTISGLMDEGHNEQYQAAVREAAWKEMLLALKDPETNQVILRNEDIVEALMDIQAIMLSTSKETDSPTKLWKWCDEFSKRLRIKTAAARDSAQTQGPIGDVIHLDEHQ